MEQETWSYVDCVWSSNFSFVGGWLSGRGKFLAGIFIDSRRVFTAYIYDYVPFCVGKAL
jgi:hypothetical protein